MVVPYGFGVGDFIAVIDLIIKVSKALRDIGGAASEYQDVVLELESLQKILTHLGNVRFVISSTTKHADTLQNLALQCQRPLQEFLDRIAGFEASLDAKTDRKLLRTAPRKMQWGAFMAAEIPKLRSVVAAKLLALQLLLQLFNAYVYMFSCSETSSPLLWLLIFGKGIASQPELTDGEDA